MSKNIPYLKHFALNSHPQQQPQPLFGQPPRKRPMPLSAAAVADFDFYEGRGGRPPPGEERMMRRDGPPPFPPYGPYAGYCGHGHEEEEEEWGERFPPPRQQRPPPPPFYEEQRGVLNSLIFVSIDSNCTNLCSNMN